MSSAGEPMSMLLNQKPSANVHKWWDGGSWVQPGQSAALSPVGNSRLKLDKNKYNHINKTVSARMELTVFCTDSVGSGEGWWASAVISVISPPPHLLT